MCAKKEFKSLKSAEKRASEINEENILNKKKNRLLRAYRCTICKKAHLTSMPKKIYEKRIIDNNKRTKKREQQFIKRETFFWESYYGLSSNHHR